MGADTIVRASVCYSIPRFGLLQQQHQMALENYLTKRPGSRYWQLRVPVPRPLHARYGRKEVTRSLKTLDRADAERRAIAILAELHREWDALGKDQGGPALILVQSQLRVPSRFELEDEAVIAAHELLLRIAAGDRERQREDDPASLMAYRAFRRKRLERYAARYAIGDLSHWEPVANRLIAKRGWTLAPGDPFYDVFVTAIAEAFMDGLRIASEMDARRAGRKPEPRYPDTTYGMRRASSGGTVGGW